MSGLPEARRRLERLERAACRRAANPAAAAAAAEAAWRDGSATIEQALLAAPDVVEDHRLELLRHAALGVVGQRHLVVQPDLPQPTGALWYPPRLSLPAALQKALALEFRSARETLAEAQAARRSAVREAAAGWRMASVIFCAAVGDEEALPLRRRIWALTGNHWELTAEVRELCGKYIISCRHAQQLLDHWVDPARDTNRVEKAVRAGLIPNRRDSDRFPAVSITDLAEAAERLGWAHGVNPEWSDQVT